LIRVKSFISVVDIVKVVVLPIFKVIDSDMQEDSKEERRGQDDYHQVENSVAVYNYQSSVDWVLRVIVPLLYIFFELLLIELVDYRSELLNVQKLSQSRESQQFEKPKETHFESNGFLIDPSDVFKRKTR
jgi:hypothetical protein